jgi:hypothetical protein
MELYELAGVGHYSDDLKDITTKYSVIPRLNGVITYLCQVRQRPLPPVTT